MKQLLLVLLRVIDPLLLPFVFTSAWFLKQIRQVGVARLPLSRSVLMNVGVFPIRNHYYEPQFDNRQPEPDFNRDRYLPGIDWNEAEQLALLQKFCYGRELENTPKSKSAAGNLEFHFNNGNFESGDAEYWYQVVRTFKPKRIIEIGSGNSTLVAIKALRKNQEENPNYQCDHVCIEPYEMQWLEQSGVKVVRKKVEEMDLAFFSQLEENDILFIDSTHIIKPQGDVLFEYLELLPTLNQGVVVHIHDIFSPKNYLNEWLQERVLFWNEQYLLEAFLSHNNDWKIIGAVNYLCHHHYDKLSEVAPFLTTGREPGSFYIQKIA